jgi:DNA-directed RNA polymerase specialized sigma24 family protein
MKICNNYTKAIEYLSDVEKSIVLLYLEDKPYEEIAEITGITANYVAVKNEQNKRKIENLIKDRAMIEIR